MQNNQPLNDAELDALEAFIFSDAVSEDSLDLIGIHGFLCALSISPNPAPEAKWLDVVFDGQPAWKSDDQRAEVTGWLTRWKNAILVDINDQEELEMPCDLVLDRNGDEDPLLEIWAQAFMEGVFLNEEDWFAAENEESVAELLLPIMVASDLFDEQEFKEIRRNRKVANQMANEIPDLLVDLYLVFHSPEK
ncbi:MULTISPECIES: YecA family protein [Neptunomonas]|uniref:YecA family protein n=1 Tax=Neptunomonas marina TaxID=1815562 RepID=A0A437QDS6_9GAMM|nr:MULTISPECIES: YecA family protein [Neptunomonas]RVU32569.1 YecA family protein [Neptunomonas marina]